MNNRRFVELVLILLCHDVYHSFSQQVLYESVNSFCNVGGKDYPCTPPVVNIMKAANVVVSSTCGEHGDEDVCPHWVYNSPSSHDDCPLCKGTSFPLDHLKDNHLQVNQTCWFSGALYNQQNMNQVNISIAFNKKFEVYYLALQFCSVFPDSVIIAKSSDHGKIWSSWQYYSKDCFRSFGLKSTLQYAQLDSTSLAPICIDLKQKSGQNKLVQMDSVIPFSPTMGRHLNETLVDWITITDLRITLSMFLQRSHSQFENGKFYFNENADKIYYGLSDISVGGRCQCHGHSNKCVIKNDGLISCSCEHNTEGIDCHRCKKSFHDVPWSRANRISAKSCQRCHCNLHSPFCHFNENVFEMSGFKSGGVCYKCLHNTAGSQCQYCEDGFYRDWSKPLSHETTCLKCKCHDSGSRSSSVCNKKSGQCFCKEGVVGKNCDRCKLGYRPTASIIRPCLRKYDVQSQPTKIGKYDSPQHHFMANTESECRPCDEKRKRIRFKKFCRRSAVFMGTIQSKEIYGKMVRFDIQIKNVWRILGKISDYISKEAIDQYSVSLWISHEDIRCECPSVLLGRSYLVLMKFKTFLYRQREELMLDSRTVMLKWKPSWKLRLTKFQEKEGEEKCQKYLLKKTKIKNKKID